MNVEPKPRSKVFVGCSKERVDIAKAIENNISASRVATVDGWYRGTSRLSQYFLDDLRKKANEVDFAVFIFSADDITNSRNIQQLSPRDNVVFEAGVFIGVLGKDRVFILAPEEQKLKQPSDLQGLTFGFYDSPRPGDNLNSIMAPLTNQIEDIIQKIGQKPIESLVLVDPFYRQSYTTLKDAAKDIKQACKEAIDLKILSITGVSSLGTDNSIISTAELESYVNLKKLRVLLMSTDSRWVTSGLASRRERESLEEYVEELRTSQKLVEIGLKRMLRHLPNVKSGIRYFVGEPNWKLIMTDKTAFVSNYADDEQRIQSRDLPVYRFDNVLGSFYSMYHRRFNDIWHNESKVGNYLIPKPEMTMSAGGIVYVELDKEAKIIVLRRFDGNWVLPKGHKIREDETINMTALREVQEETGLSTDQLLVEHMIGHYADNSYSTEQKEVFIYLMRFTGKELPDLVPDPDHVEARWVSVSEAIRLVANSNQRAIISKFDQSRAKGEIQSSP